MHYVGSGPYCYANSLAMVLGADAPDPSAIEVLTGSPFGVLLLDGRLPFFSPNGWTPSIGLDMALELLGWTCERSAGGDSVEAINRLRAATRQAPVVVGPVEIGLLLHHPGSGRAIGSDHYVVALNVDEEVVQFHDPHGYPFATLPIESFICAWKADSITYANEPYAMRFDFRRARDIPVEAALRASIPNAVRRLAREPEEYSLAGAAAVNMLASQVEDGLDAGQQGHLIHFAVRVGVRRLADASRWLRAIGLVRPSEIARNQARLLGCVQYDLVAGDPRSAAATLRLLAPCYADIQNALADAVGSLTA